MKKWIVLIAVVIGFGTILGGCGGSSKSGISEDKEIRIGVTPGPHAQVVEDVKKRAEKEGLKIRIVEFSDYVQPNVALSQGEIDINIFQHKPYLDNMVADRSTRIL